MTVFATQKRQNENLSDEASSLKRSRTDPGLDRISEVGPGTTSLETSVSNPTTSNPHGNTTTEPMDQNNPLPSLDNTSVIPQSLPQPGVSHGPKFLKLDPQKQNMIKKIHQNLGHPDNRVLQIALRRYGWSEPDAAACSDFCCSTCFEKQLPKVARPGTLSKPRDFNDHISFDGAEWKDHTGKTYHFYHFIDSATNYHTAIPYQQRSTEGLIEAFSNAWLRWAGPPKSIMFDSTTEANSDQFAKFLQDLAIHSYVIPVDAHWQLGRAERHGATLMRMIDKYHTEKPIRNEEDFNQCLMQLCHAKNAMSRHEGYTPELWVLGKMKPVPGSNTNQFLDSASFSGLDLETTEGARFQEQLSRREAARIAFIRADHCSTLRRALHARSRPHRMTYQVGEFVMYWKDGRGVEKGSWHGPAKVLMIEGSNLVWVSHLTKLFRCAPEHVRQLSMDEARSINDSDRSLFQMPDQSGHGVFRFRELTGQQGPPEMPSQRPNEVPRIPQPPEPDIIIQNNSTNTEHNNNLSNPHHNSGATSIGQPDDEPTVPSTPTALDPAVITPVPDDTDDDLLAHAQSHDYWQVQGNNLIRHHVVPRIKPFFPYDAWQCPVKVDDLESGRITSGTFVSGGNLSLEDTWTDNVQSHVPMPEPWTGQTQFTIAHVPVNHVQGEVAASQELVDKNDSSNHQVMFAELEMNLDDFNKCLGKTYHDQEVYLASAAKRQKVEVKLRDLSTEDLKLFNQAKEKELDSWLATDTVRRILRNQVPEGQLLRSRWVLTWKPLDPEDQQKCGKTHKPKARLVTLGYEDPMIDSLPRDSPTLGRDSRMLALQCIASHRWTARSFDIRTAFLRESRQDSRILGIEPTNELRVKMKLQNNEVCELLKGAYGLINAPLLWYCELKGALLSLGFIISPLDPCLFVLPKKGKIQNGEPKIHGILGIHVGDGIGGGDSTFTHAIQCLEKRFPFGSQRQGSFTFTGIQLKQEVNGDISLNQQGYINDINPINVTRDRRKTPEAPITQQELQDLRGLIGSLQYAATNTRPDLSCRLSLLQAKVTCATVSDLLNGNRLWNDAKRFSNTEVKIQSLSPNKVRFLSFSDAAFATREKAHSQKGCLILATTDEIDEIKSSQVSPLIWFSKKINRVVASTLASETYALSGALDLLSWTRLHWAWLLDPSLDWKQPDTTLKSLPFAYAVVDCKSLYDLLQKTSIPQCTEHRTALEALVIRDRLKEGVVIKWVHSAAQMADSLTKDMDTSVLRSFLAKGKCILHDIDEVLKQRADKKIRQQWYQQSSDLESGLHAFALCLEMLNDLA